MRALTEQHARAALALGGAPDLIGFHGQTLLHRPDQRRSWQVGDAALLARLRRSFGGSWAAALASYNAGTKRVLEAWERCGRRDGPEFVESLEIPETWDYVHRVVLLAEGYRILYWPDGRPYPWT